jgi:hypothetical protein
MEARLAGVVSRPRESGSAEEPMLRGDVVREIIARKERGTGIKRIARELGVDRKTVKRWRRLGGWQPRRPQLRRRLIEQFTEFIAQRGPEVGWNGVVLHRELAGLGFSGSYQQVQRYLKPHRAQREQLFGPVVAGQRRGNLRFAGLAAAVAMGGQRTRVAHPGQNVAHNRHTGYSGDVTEHVMQLEIHQGQGLLHAMHAGSRGFNQGLAVAHIAAQRYDRTVWTEAGMEQAHAMQFLQPLAVLDVSLASAHVVHVMGIDQHHLQPALLQHFVEWDPIDPGRLHRHGLDATLHQPVSQVVEVGGGGAEFTDRFGIALRRYGHKVAGGATVDARRGWTRSWGPGDCPSCQVPS